MSESQIGSELVETEFYRYKICRRGGKLFLDITHKNGKQFTYELHQLHFDEKKTLKGDIFNKFVEYQNEIYDGETGKFTIGFYSNKLNYPNLFPNVADVNEEPYIYYRHECYDEIVNGKTTTYLRLIHISSEMKFRFEILPHHYIDNIFLDPKIVKLFIKYREVEFDGKEGKIRGNIVVDRKEKPYDILFYEPEPQ